MKNLRSNKKGFTLIELLAVIVILAILVMVAIPAVTKYLNESRKGTFADNALAAIGAVRNEAVIEGLPSGTTYYLDDINDLLEKKLLSSPFGQQYETGSYITINIADDGTTTYSMCLTDKGGNGLTVVTGEGENEEKRNVLKEEEISKDTVLIGTAKACGEKPGSGGSGE